MSLTKEQSDAVFEATVELRKTLQWSSYNLGYAPELMTAMACGAALCGLGIQNLIVAGSALWLVMSEEDQGDAMIEGRKVHPFFGFKFDMTKELAKLMTLKYPDEIHVWCQDEDGCIYEIGRAHV